MRALIFACSIVALLACLGCGTRTGDGPFPIIEHDRVVFQNGRKVRFEGDTVALQNNIKRPEIDKPVNMIERAFTVEEWNRVIVETEYGYWEDGGFVFRFYDFNGKLLRKTPEYFGGFRVLLMTKVDRMILVQVSAHYALTEGYILDTDGNQVMTITQKPDAYDALVCEEGDLFLIEYSRRSKGVPYWTVEVLDAEGKVMATRDFLSGGSYNIEVEERKIPVSLPNPQ